MRQCFPEPLTPPTAEGAGDVCRPICHLPRCLCPSASSLWPSFQSYHLHVNGPLSLCLFSPAHPARDTRFLFLEQSPAVWCSSPQSRRRPSLLPKWGSPHLASPLLQVQPPGAPSPVSGVGSPFQGHSFILPFLRSFPLALPQCRLCLSGSHLLLRTQARHQATHQPCLASREDLFLVGAFRAPGSTALLSRKASRIFHALLCSASGWKILQV